MKIDPNIKFARQVIELTFQQWDYKAKKSVTIRSNATGMDTIKGALFDVYTDIVEGSGELEMKNESGDILLCSDDAGLGQHWLELMLVSAELVAFEAA